ncbi:DUF397 domain-containing protein [Streptomyces longisporoflavus]|uniref:DUF397 domain-containing protein n=1 Tax=Streptomyces longisporoflavus TaxID=28044 RepID=UPI00167DEBA8|nr:DUF397 domain-containing protein [Streptomyces longisporoflavus]
MTTTITWQKSSFSGGGDGANCVEIGLAQSTIHLRESDTPDQVLSTSPESLAALIRHVRTRRPTSS